MGILSTIKAYALQALAVALLLLVGYQTMQVQLARSGEAKAVTTLANERTASASARLAKQEETRMAERALDMSASATRKATNDQVVALSAQRDSLLERVRRAEASAPAVVPRAAPAASAGAPGSGSPVPELLAALGAEDVREAERADTIRLHLDACYAQYDRAAASLKALAP